MQKGSNYSSRPEMVLIGIFTVVLALALITGCSAQNSAKEPSSVRDVVQNLEKASLIGDLQIGDIETLCKLYDLDADLVEDFALYTAPSNICADEILVLKLKDSKDLEQVKAKVEDRVAKRADSFRDYLPEQYALIENHCLVTAGNYIFLAIAEDVAAAEEAFWNAGR